MWRLEGHNGRHFPLKESCVTHAGTSAVLAAFVADLPDIPDPLLEDATVFGAGRAGAAALA